MERVSDFNCVNIVFHDVNMFWVPLNLGGPPNKIALTVGSVTACNFKEIRELLNGFS
jgi:hypothetical protein